MTRSKEELGWSYKKQLFFFEPNTEKEFSDEEISYTIKALDKIKEMIIKAFVKTVSEIIIINEQPNVITIYNQIYESNIKPNEKTLKYLMDRNQEFNYVFKLLLQVKKAFENDGPSLNLNNINDNLNKILKSLTNFNLSLKDNVMYLFNNIIVIDRIIDVLNDLKNKKITFEEYLNKLISNQDPWIVEINIFDIIMKGIDLLSKIEEYTIDLDNLETQWRYLHFSKKKAFKDFLSEYFDESVVKAILWRYFPTKDINNDFIIDKIVHTFYNMYKKYYLDPIKLDIKRIRWLSCSFNETINLTKDDLIYVINDKFYKDKELRIKISKIKQKLVHQIIRKVKFSKGLDKELISLMIIAKIIGIFPYSYNTNKVLQRV